MKPKAMWPPASRSSLRTAAAAATHSSRPVLQAQRDRTSTSSPDLAENANQPVANFTRTGITDPSAYIEEGFPDGVMPAYDQLSDEDVNNLVAFLTQN